MAGADEADADNIARAIEARPWPTYEERMAAFSPAGPWKPSRAAVNRKRHRNRCLGLPTIDELLRSRTAPGQIPTGVGQANAMATMSIQPGSTATAKALFVTSCKLAGNSHERARPSVA